MKAILIVSVITLFSVGTVSAGEITVINPDNQSMWLIGSKQEITWKVQGDTPNLTITLWRGNIKMGVIADGIAVDPVSAITYTMTYSWKVGDLLGGKALPGNNYQIGIQAQGSPYCYKSASYFEIREMKAFKQFPKPKFWDFSIGSVKFKPHYTHKVIWTENTPQNNIIYIHNGCHNKCWVNITPTIKMKTPPKSQITKADVSKWGTPRFFQSELDIFNSPPQDLWNSGLFGISTPQFTWEDVQTWPEEGKTFEKHPLGINWGPSESEIAPYFGKLWYHVKVYIDKGNKIKEIDEINNNIMGPCIVFTTDEKGGQLELHDDPKYKYLIGSTKIIRWKAKNVGRMQILLYQSAQYPDATNKLIGVIADNILPPPPGPSWHEMSRSWKVGQLLKRKEVVKPGKLYWIMIKTKGNWSTGNNMAQTNEKDWFTITQYFKMKIKPKATLGRDSRQKPAPPTSRKLKR